MTIQTTVMIPRCWHCNGSGAKSGVNTNVPYLRPDEKCERCKGSGHEPEKHWIECPECLGKQELETGTSTDGCPDTVECFRCNGEGMIFVDADGEESEMEQALRRAPLREQEQRWREAEQLRDEKQLGELW